MWSSCPASVRAATAGSGLPGVDGGGVGVRGGSVDDAVYAVRDVQPDARAVVVGRAGRPRPAPAGGRGPGRGRAGDAGGGPRPAAQRRRRSGGARGGGAGGAGGAPVRTGGDRYAGGAVPGGDV